MSSDPVALARALAPWLERMVALDGVAGRAVVGCSGGADSSALLALVRARGLQATAVYVDHGLGPSAVEDERAVRTLADALGAELAVAHVAVTPGGNLEARARGARYAALERVRAEVEAGAVLVGHTRDDQAETVLLNLLRGSGTAGLAGMPARRGSLHRPLLRLRRADTREICARLGISPRDDPMNSDSSFRRVWLRRDVIPRLDHGAQRDVVEVLARQADVLRDEDELLDRLSASIAPEAGALDVAALRAADTALARRAVRRWLGPPPPSLAQVESVLEVATGSRRAVELPNGRRVERARGALHLTTVAEAPRSEPLVVPGALTFGTTDVTSWIEAAAPAGWPDGCATAVVDADRAGDGLVVRAPNPGDRFVPVGRSGERLVHDVLAEAGVPASARARHPLVVDRSGAVVWVVGYRVDDRVRAGHDTRRYLWITAEPRGSTS